MSLYIKKEVKLKHRVSTSGYHLNNLKNKEMRRKKLGSSISAVNRLLGSANFKKVVIAKIIRNSSADVKFDQRVEDYFDAISISVPFEGKTLNVSLTYPSDEIADKYEGKETIIRKKYHDMMTATGTGLKEQRDLFKERTDKLIALEEEKLGAGAEPVNHDHYLIWRYSLINNEVANRELDAGTSINIRFYLLDIADNALAKSDKEDKVVIAHTMFTDIMGDKSKVNDLYEVLFPTGKDKSLPTKQVKLMEYILRNPNQFITRLKDKDMTIKAAIERLVKAGILKRFPSSSLIVDTMTQEKIGRNVAGAVEWFNNPDNKDAITQLTNRYKNKIK